MARKSRLLQILHLAEDFLLFFDDHFKDSSWVYHHSGMSRQAKLRSKKYLRQEDIILSDFSLDLSEKSTYSLMTEPWDEKWRVVSFDIPEKNRKLRDKIRYSLRQLGLKNLQRSLWISPLPVDKFSDRIRKKLDDPRRLVILVGELKGVSSKKLVQRLWNLNAWRDKAMKLLDLMEEVDKIDTKLEKKFWSLALDHPKIPIGLLPNNWPLNRLVATFTQKTNPDG